MQQNLAGSRAQDVAHLHIQRVRIAQELPQRVIQIVQIFQRSVHNAGAQAAIQLVQVDAAQPLVQR